MIGLDTGLRMVYIADMRDYVINTGIIGVVMALVVVPIYGFTAVTEHEDSPRKVIATCIASFLGVVLATILFPVFIAAGVLYVAAAMIKNDWIWYKR